MDLLANVAFFVLGRTKFQEFWYTLYMLGGLEDNTGFIAGFKDCLRQYIVHFVILCN